MAYSEAKGAGHRGKKLDHLKVARGHNDGYSVEHHFEQPLGSHYIPPEVHNFGPEEGHEMIAHVAHHMNVDLPETPGEPEEPEEEDKQPAEGRYYTESKGRKG